ncbi:MAG: hydroxyacylglutathione hydrolase family protein [Planctomycetota bacterium]
MTYWFEQVLLEGGNRNFAYAVGCTNHRVAALIDPAFQPDRMVQLARDQGMRITHLLNTHGHDDHTNGNTRVRELVPDVILGANPVDVPGPDLELHGGESVQLGDVTIRAIATPGHTPGHLCFLINEEKLVAGDVLFVGKIGGTGAGFKRSDPRVQHHSLFEVLMKLPDAVEVWPGHNFGVAPSSTIAHEKATNPFILRPRFEDFMWLKDNWAQYREEHGIK